jgi:hypothetical protein
MEFTRRFQNSTQMGFAAGMTDQQPKPAATEGEKLRCIKIRHCRKSLLLPTQSRDSGYKLDVNRLLFHREATGWSIFVQISLGHQRTQT